MKIELELKKMLDFIYACNVDSNHGNDLSNQTLMAENYLKRLKTIDKNGFEIVDEYIITDTLGNKEKMIVLLNMLILIILLRLCFQMLILLRGLTLGQDW